MPTLHWIGKEKVIKHHLDVPYRVLEHEYGFTEKGKQSNSTESGNMIIHGDNLEALKSLLPKYEGKVDIVYIDPPYNTGKEKWIYTDNVNHPKIEKWLNDVVGAEGDDLSRHDKWLCMMYPRLQLIHRLLKPDGIFFCSIDDYEHGNLKPMLDEIFGPLNFLNNVIWQRAYAPINTKKRFSPNHDFIICYAKEKNKVNLLLPRTDDANDKYSNPDNDKRGFWQSDNFSVGPAIADKIYEITTPAGRKVLPPHGRCWLLTKERYQEFLDDNRIWFGASGKGVPRIKRFINEVKDGITPLTVWTYDEVGHTQDAKREIKELFPDSQLPFETPKPTILMEKILSLKNDPNAIILDSFAGTATTGHATLNLNKKDKGNRKFILIELEEYAEKITSERIKKIIQGYPFIGKKKKELANYSISISTLKKSEKIIAEYEKYNADKKYSGVTIESNNGNLSIFGTEDLKEKTEGTGGSFDFYSLGKPLFNEDDTLNEEVEIEKIREYIWFTETRTSNGCNNEIYLGQFNDTGYYFIYKKNELTTLDYETLGGYVKTKAERYIIYADNCLLPEAFMLLHNIEFKKIPRDITRF